MSDEATKRSSDETPALPTTRKKRRSDEATERRRGRAVPSMGHRQSAIAARQSQIANCKSQMPTQTCHTGAATVWGLGLATLMGLAVLAGCGGKDKDKVKEKISVPTTHPFSTDIDPVKATANYWLDQPANSEMTFTDFQKLWDTCEAVSYDYLFKISRRDYRHGQLTTEPMLSKQWFELWRKDGPTGRDVEEASLGGIRRTIYFQFTQNLDGSYTVAPKVLVERESKIEPRYRPDLEPDAPLSYWYALRRDAQMEIRLVTAIREKLGAKG